MAIITSTYADFSLASSYYCSNGLREWDLWPGQTGIEGTSTSLPTKASRTVTFNYTDISNESVNMAILQMTSGGSTFGGTLYVNDKAVYPTNGLYTFYLDTSVLGATSISFIISYTTYTPNHSHIDDYDTKVAKYTGQDSAGPFTIYEVRKNHTGTQLLKDITLKIYTGDDAIIVPSTAQMMVGVEGIAKKVKDIFVGINGKAKKISEAWVGIGGIARKIWPCLNLKNLSAGSIIQLDESGNGLVDYIVVAQNHYLNDVNTEEHTVLMRKNLLNSTSTYGNNTYGEAYVGENLDTYVNEAWKASLNGNIILKLMNITIPCNKWSSPYTSTAERQVWVPSRDEIDETYTEKHEGPCFDYFIGKNTNADRIAYTDNGTAQTWWTRSCVEGMGSDGAYIRVVKADGNFNNYGQQGGYYCRPVFCLPASLPVSQVSEGIYNLIL